MKHSVKTFSKSGKILYEESFKTAEEAYKTYCTLVKILEAVPKGTETTVVRYNDGYPMAMETVRGTL